MNKRWKNLIIGMVVLFLVTPALSHADFALGVKGGIGWTSAYGDDWDTLTTGLDTPGRLRITAGVFVTLGLFPFLALQPEILYTIYAARAEVDDDNGLTFSTDYIEIPVLAKLLLPVGPGRISVFAGPNLQLLPNDGTLIVEVGGSDTDADIPSEDLNGFLIGLAFGAGYDLPIAAKWFLAFDGRYVLMFTDVPDDAEVRSRGLFITVGAGIRL